MTVPARWAFSTDDASRLDAVLRQLLADTQARTAMLIDRAGQLIALQGAATHFDPTSFATLTAADFSANDQLARLLGEPEFGALFHQGERASMFLADVARRVILCVLFDTTTTVGLVKLRARPAVTALAAILADAATRPAQAALDAQLAGDAADEIDRLFGQ